MESKNKKPFERLKDDLERLESDQQIDYKEEDLLMKSDKGGNVSPSDFWQDTKRAAKNFLVASLCVVIALLWWFDWNFSTLVNSTSNVVSDLFGDEASQVATAPNQSIPSIPEMPPMPEFQEMPENVREEIETAIEQERNELNMAMSEYIREMEEAGLREMFSMPAITTFYQVGVELNYLEELHEAGLLNQFSFPAIVAFHSAEVNELYLQELQKEGLLDQFSFPAITSFYASDIPISYLTDLRDKGLLQDLSFSDIIMMYESENN
ncbi:MAG: hypothetical protein U5K69_19605 [Balneolaceae bacterium]|nr:hypothetical protein [Balneolaceae bacterium]